MKALNIALLAALAMIGLATPALAQSTPLPSAYVCNSCTASLAVTNTSGRVALPSTSPPYGTLTVYNSGTKDAYFVQGGVTAVATTSGIYIPSGARITLNVNGTYLAAITGGSDTTALKIWQSNGLVDFGSGASGGSVTGTVTANQGTPNAGTAQSWWVQIYNSLVGVLGADGTTIASTSNPLPIQGSRTQGSTTSGQTGILDMQATTTAPPTYTNGQTNPVTGDTHGGVRVVPQDTNGTVANFTTPTLVIQTSQYPNGSTPITGNATGTTGAVVGTLAGTSGKTTYICGFDVSALGGTATVGPITVAGTTGSSMVYQFSSLAAGNTLPVRFNMCVPASSTNTAITITTTADGTASAVDVNSFGYQL